MTVEQPDLAVAAAAAAAAATRLTSRGRGVMMGRGMIAASVRRDQSTPPAAAPLPEPPVVPTTVSHMPTPVAAVEQIQKPIISQQQVETKMSKMTLVEQTQPQPGKTAAPAKQPAPTTAASTTVGVTGRSDDGQQTVMSSTTGAGAGGGAAMSAATRTSDDGGSRSSLQRAGEELRMVEQIQRRSPVRRMGEAGERANFVTNYIKLTCKNSGVYQYVVHFNPPVDSTYHRVKIVYFLKDIIGDVRLFDGVTLFLPILLKDRVSSKEKIFLP